MPNTTLAVRRTDSEPGASEGQVGEGSKLSSGTLLGIRVPGGRWTIAFLSVIGTLVLAYLLSPGLRSDVNGLVALVGNISAVGIQNWILSFGAWAPFVYISIMMAQVIASPIPAGPIALAGALVFGVWEGLALALTGSVVGSILIFTAVRLWGEPLVVRLVGREFIVSTSASSTPRDGGCSRYCSSPSCPTTRWSPSLGSPRSPSDDSC